MWTMQETGVKCPEFKCSPPVTPEDDIIMDLCTNIPQLWGRNASWVTDWRIITKPHLSGSLSGMGAWLSSFCPEAFATLRRWPYNIHSESANTTGSKYSKCPPKEEFKHQAQPLGRLGSVIQRPTSNSLTRARGIVMSAWHIYPLNMTQNVKLARLASKTASHSAHKIASVVISACNSLHSNGFSTCVLTQKSGLFVHEAVLL